MRVLTVGVLLLGCAIGLGCGPSGKRGIITPKPRAVEMEGEEFVVKAPTREVALDFDDEVIDGDVYHPKGVAPAFVLTSAKPLPTTKEALSLEVLRAAFAKAKGKARMNQAEWFTLAVLDKLAREPASESAGLRAEAITMLEAAVADKAAGETTWVMLATMQYSAGQFEASAKTFLNVLDEFPKSKLRGRYAEQRAWAQFAASPASTDGKDLPRDTPTSHYLAGWIERRMGGSMERAASEFKSALKLAPPEPLATAIRHDLLNTLAWRGAGESALSDEVRGLGGAPAAQVQNLLEVAQVLADKGDFASAAHVLTALLGDAAASPTQVVTAYEILAQQALVERRLGDLANLMEKLLATAALATVVDDQTRAAQICWQVGTTLHIEWGNTRETAAADAAARVYAALLAYKPLPAELDVAGAARDLKEQRASSEPPPAAESDKDLVRRIVRLNMKSTRHCYERELETRWGAGFAVASGLQDGRWQFTLVPEATGAGSQVTTLAITVPQLVSTDLTRCLEQAAARWKFPPHAKSIVITINYGFAFRTAP